MKILKNKSISKSLAVIMSLAVLNISFAAPVNLETVVINAGTTIQLETMSHKVG